MKNNINNIQKLALSKNELREKIESKLFTRGITLNQETSDEQLYNAVAQVFKELLLEKRESFKRRIKAVGSKKVCYLCMEFLVGRALKNTAINIGVYEDLCELLQELGTSFERIYACETDPGLGNGGLGRLAACFMDSLTALDYAANGYSLLYENGLFRQKIVDGEQIELPDEWLGRNGVWLVPRMERSVTVRVGGRITEIWKNDGLKTAYRDYEEIRAIPYDLMIPGTTTDAVNTIRLWRAKSSHKEGTEYSSQEEYINDIKYGSSVESITKQLYPKDDYDGGKLLRITQQYFLVSASLQSIITDYLTEYGTLIDFENKISIHINDTHPSLCIPELMRILMDIYSYSWDDAWRIVVKTVSYTNHTVLPEALECWRVDLFAMKLPRIYSIISEINKRFTADLWTLYPGDWDRISRMSIIAYNQVRMANLSVVGSHTVNGVSKLHSEILKKTIFHDFYKLTPWKFTNVTNGIYHRRWLNSANRNLSDFLDELIGSEYRENPEKLNELLKFENDATVIQKIGDIKNINKARFAEYSYKKFGIKIDPNSIYDVQIKRMHEYKRQLLNVIKIISLYNRISENPNADIQPQTFIFGCKAAPGYAMAKNFIKLIWYLAKDLQENRATRDILKILFVEDYNVSIAEELIPAADISEQISLAGKEASGTGCMKLMMNGAVTIGTLDGANIEILEAVGKENMYTFGMNSKEVVELWSSGYSSRRFYTASDELRNAVDRLYYPIGGVSFPHIADYLVGANNIVADPFMCLADFDSYVLTYNTATSDYREASLWNRKSLVNIAKSGIFSSDRSVREYAENIWHIKPVSANLD